MSPGRRIVWHREPVQHVAVHDANGKPLRTRCPYVNSDGARCAYSSAPGRADKTGHAGAHRA